MVGSKMLISRAPLRVSLFGGGSDFPEYFKNNIGCVVGGTINKYVYVNFLKLAEESKEKYRLTYRITESVLSPKEFKHPAYREILKYYDWKLPLNVATMSDLPGNTGLGSSSSFCVATINGLNFLINQKSNALENAMKAIEIEREILNERGGWQDQLHSSVGNFRSYTFSGSDVKISEPLLSDAQLRFLSESCFLLYIGNERHSQDLQKENLNFSSDKVLENNLEKLAQQALRISKMNLIDFSNDELLETLSWELTESWNIKQQVLKETKEGEIYQLMEFGKKIGTLASKLCGAGKGGYILFLCNPNEKSRIISEFIKHNKIVRPIQFISEGASILSYS